jgi:hypothetical protein
MSQTHHDVKSSSVRNSWKESDDTNEPTEWFVHSIFLILISFLFFSVEPPSTSTSRTHIPDALQDYDHVCSKCNMPFVSQTSLDEHQNGQ